MTAPVPVIRLPYAVTYTPNSGAPELSILPAQRNAGGPNNHALDPGTYTVQLAWDGSEECRLRRHKGGAWEDVATIPAGVAGTARLARPIQVNSDAVMSLGVYLATNATSSTVSGKRIAALTIYPVSNYTP